MHVVARYEHLPVYKAALEAAVHFETAVAGFSLYHKYTRGTEVRNASRLVVEQVIRANSARQRLPELIRRRDGLERVLVLLRLAKEVKAFKNFQAYSRVTQGTSLRCGRRPARGSCRGAASRKRCREAG